MTRGTGLCKNETVKNPDETKISIWNTNSSVQHISRIKFAMTLAVIQTQRHGVSQFLLKKDRTVTSASTYTIVHSVWNLLHQR